MREQRVGHGRFPPRSPERGADRGASSALRRLFPRAAGPCGRLQQAGQALRRGGAAAALPEGSPRAAAGGRCPGLPPLSARPRPPAQDGGFALPAATALPGVPRAAREMAAARNYRSRRAPREAGGLPAPACTAPPAAPPLLPPRRPPPPPPLPGQAWAVPAGGRAGPGSDFTSGGLRRWEGSGAAGAERSRQPAGREAAAAAEQLGAGVRGRGPSLCA